MFDAQHVDDIRVMGHDFNLLQVRNQEDYWLPSIVNLNSCDIDVPTSVQQEIVPQCVLDLWHNTDLTWEMRQYAPQNKTTIISSEAPTSIVKSIKTTMSKYPIMSRPVLTK